jgi:hypothetical protein
MKKTNRIRHWRLNILVIYYGQLNANCYRVDILALLRHLASIYKLDYAISEAHQFPSESGLTGQDDDTSIVDLAYFRSNENSRVDKKEFRSVIDCMFGKVPSPFFEGVEICTQLYKALAEYPFPSDFFRPLRYPYVEIHKDSQKTLCIYADEVMKVIEDEQDFRLN